MIRRLLIAARARPKSVVMIVDDMKDARDIYAAYFESRGFGAIRGCGIPPDVCWQRTVGIDNAASSPMAKKPGALWKRGAEFTFESRTK